MSLYSPSAMSIRPKLLVAMCVYALFFWTLTETLGLTAFLSAINKDNDSQKVGRISRKGKPRLCKSSSDKLLVSFTCRNESLSLGCLMLTVTSVQEDLIVRYGVGRRYCSAFFPPRLLVNYDIRMMIFSALLLKVWLQFVLLN